MRFAVALALLVPLAHADVLVVSDAGGFPNVAAAVAAASDGDTILVKTSDLTPFTISGKSLTISAFDNSMPAPYIGGPITVEGLAAGQTVVLNRLSMAPGFPFGGDKGLVLDGNDGVVWAQQCLFTNEFEKPAVVVHDSALLVLVETTVRGGAKAGTGLVVDGGVVAAHACEIRGGEGLSGLTFGTDGGDAVQVLAGTFRAMGGTIGGGSGGETEDDGDCGAPGDGGDGIVLGAGASASVSDDTLVAGGLKGFTFSGCTIGDPTNGETVVGTLGELRWETHGVRVPGLLREGEAALLRLYGEPGASALLLVSFGAALGPMPAQQMPVLVNLGSTIVLPIGVLDAAGQLNIPIAGPALPAGVGNVRVFLQGLFQSDTDHAIGSGSALSLLDTSF